MSETETRLSAEVWESSDIESLDQLFHASGTRYGALKAASEASVVRWEWASACMYDPRPHWYARHRWLRGVVLHNRPTELDGKHEYGYDASGRLVVERAHTSFPGYADGSWFDETFHTFSDCQVYSARFQPNPTQKLLMNVSRQRHQSGRIVLHESRGTGGFGREVVHYRDGLATRIDVMHANVRGGAPYVAEPYQQIEARYGVDGLVQEVAILWLPRRPELAEIVRTVAYQRLDPWVTRHELCALVKAQLLYDIRKAVVGARLTDPVYSLAVWWSPGQFQSLPPAIGLGLERERTKWLADHDQNVKWMLWNPSEYVNFFTDALRLQGADLLRLSELLNQELGMHDDWELGTNMLIEVARELSRCDWQGALITTSDFVAFATDPDQSICLRSIEASASPSTLAAFVAKDWLN